MIFFIIILNVDIGLIRMLIIGIFKLYFLYLSIDKNRFVYYNSYIFKQLYIFKVRGEM